MKRCLNMCGIYVLCEKFAHKYEHTHMNGDLLNRGALERCSQGYPKLHGAVQMLCPYERVSQMS